MRRASFEPGLSILIFCVSLSDVANNIQFPDTGFRAFVIQMEKIHVVMPERENAGYLLLIVIALNAQIYEK